MLVCSQTDMEEHTDTVDYVIDNTEKDLLMRVEEQISTLVAKTERSESLNIVGH